MKPSSSTTLKDPMALALAVPEHAEPVTAEYAFRQYAPYVAAVALRLLGRDDEVDDVVQEVFLDAVRGLGRLRDPAAAKAWLATVAVRVARRKLRRRRLRALFFGVELAHGYDDVAAPECSPEHRVLMARVYATLDALPVDHRLAWTLRHVEGEALESVAALCNCSLATAKRWIAAAHAEVAKGLGHG